MKIALNLLLYVSVMIGLAGCRKELSEEGGKPVPDINAEWEFKEGGVQFKGVMDTAFIESQGQLQALSITGSTEDGTGTIFFQIIDNDISTGTYSNPVVFFGYAVTGTLVYENRPANTGEFTVTITRFDSLGVSGTFSGKVVDGTGNVKDITDGKFEVELSSDDPQAPVATGQLVAWSKELCGGNGPVEITVNRQTASITQATASQPVCGGSGNANFVLPVGNYTLKAKCGTDSVFYAVTITEGTCSQVEIDFANAQPIDDYLPLTSNSNWTYRDVVDNSSKATITSTVIVDINGTQYTRFVSDLGDTTFYRKVGNTYYQYAQLNLQGLAPDPPAFEYIILKDNEPTGTKWESTQVPIVLSGISLQAKLELEITDRDFNATIGGNDYENLIEVRTTLMVLDPFAGWTPLGEAFTIFSKGVGIVYYDDAVRGTSWELESHQLF
jgi:hypothetical protein